MPIKLFTPNTPHCKECQTENPPHHEGYTFCCNKSLCDSDERGLCYRCLYPCKRCTRIIDFFEEGDNLDEFEGKHLDCAKAPETMPRVHELKRNNAKPEPKAKKTSAPAPAAKKSTSSHANCQHENTKSARAKCRRENKK